MKTLRVSEPTSNADALLRRLLDVVNGENGRDATNALITCSVRAIIMARKYDDSEEMRRWMRGTGDLLHLLADCPIAEMIQIAENATLPRDQ